MFSNFFQNTTKNQQIAILILSQVLVAIIVAAIFSVPSPEIEQEVKVADSPSAIPTSETDSYKMRIYKLLAKVYPNAPLEQAVVTVREGSYEEVKEGNITKVNFLADVDEYKQTYSVYIEWSKTKELPDGVSVDCPKKQDMKYQETFCVGNYYNTDSIGLYIPYEENGIQMTLNYSDKTQIDVYVRGKDDAEYQTNLNKAQQYLAGSGIDFSVYKTNYIRLRPGD